MQVLFPNHDFLCLFDQSSGHTFKRENCLDPTNMNLGFVGKNTSPMRSSKVTKDEIGNHPGKLKHNDVQCFDFPQKEDCSEEDGPFWMTKEERLETRDDKFAPDTETKEKTYKELRLELIAKGLIEEKQRPRRPTLVALATANNIAIDKKINNVSERDKTCTELVTELTSIGYIFDRRNYRKPELQGLATNRNINTKVSERSLTEGWAGKRKGYLQTLWESGHIDPSIPISKIQSERKQNNRC
jgi:hypothetical protein